MAKYLQDSQNAVGVTPDIARLVRALSCLVAVSLSACAHGDAPEDVLIPQVSNENSADKTSPFINTESGTDINQIGTRDGQLSASQIPANKDTDKLTVDQLRAYADRCLPDSQNPPPPGLDCSEIRLRMERVFRSEDKVTEALITLDRLGRSDNSKTVQDDLKDGRFSSLGAQAVASGFLDTEPAVPEVPAEEFTDFLLENGLAIEAGTIIANTPNQ